MISTKLTEMPKCRKVKTDKYFRNPGEIAKIPKMDENSKITENRQILQNGRKRKITKNHGITNLGIYRKIDDRPFTTR